MTLSGINVVRAWQEGSRHGFYIHAAKMGQWTPPDLAHVVFEEAVIRHQRERNG